MSSSFLFFMSRRLIVNSLLVCVLVTLVSCKPYVVRYEKSASEATIHAIYIVNHEWHTGIVIPSAPIYSALPALAERFNHTPYLEFGWGDESFYQANEIDFWLILQAIFWPTAFRLGL